MLISPAWSLFAQCTLSQPTPLLPPKWLALPCLSLITSFFSGSRSTNTAVLLLTATKKSQVSEPSDTAWPPILWAWRALLHLPVKKSWFRDYSNELVTSCLFRSHSTKQSVRRYDQGMVRMIRMIRELVPPVRRCNASVVAPLPRSRAFSLPPHTTGWTSTCAAWHGPKAQAPKGALWASLPLRKASGTHCVFGVSIARGHDLSRWHGLTTYGRTTSTREQQQDVMQQFCPAGVCGKPSLAASPGLRLALLCRDRTPPRTAEEAFPWDKSTVNCKVDVFKVSALHRAKQKQEPATGCNPSRLQIGPSIKAPRVSEVPSPNASPVGSSTSDIRSLI